jgi:hypothetical protein
VQHPVCKIAVPVEKPFELHHYIRRIIHPSPQSLIKDR